MTARNPSLDTDIASEVHRAFAAALRMPVERVAELDRLEALGCDSLRIVEITVALRNNSPGCPARSCSSIAR